MIPSSHFGSALKRAGLCALFALLAGCTTTPKQAAVEVTSPPPPTSGTQRIMAYDAYAATLFAPTAAAITAGDSGDKHAITSTLD